MVQPITVANSNNPWISTLTDPGVKADVTALAADGELSYADVVKILADVVNSGTVSASQMQSLQTLVSNLNLGVVVSDYVASALIQIVNGSPANANWNGGASTTTTLGNLQVGTTGAQLNKLVGKWLQGTDMPDPTSYQFDIATQQLKSTIAYPTSYKSFALPLFGSSGGASASDINQGNIGDCVVCASMIEMVTNHPDMLKSMIVDNGNNTFGVRFYVNGNEVWETVNNQLPVNTNNGRLVYNSSGSNPDPTLWADLIEKAYAQLNATGMLGHPAVNSYANINADPVTTVLKALTGCSNVTYLNSSDANWTSDKQVIIAAIANKQDVIISTGSSATDTTTDSNGRMELVNDHAHAVVGYDTATGNFIVRNPWGTQAYQNWDTQFEVSMADIVHVHGYVAIDNSAQTSIQIVETQRISQGNAYPAAVCQSNGAVPVTPMFSVSDSNGLPIAQYLLQTTGGDVLHLNGATNLASPTQQAQNQVVVSQSDLSKLTFSPAATTGNATLLVSAYDGKTWSPATPLSIAIQSNHVLTTPVSGLVLQAGEMVGLSTLFSVDPGVNLANNSYAQITVDSGNGSINLQGAPQIIASPPPGTMGVWGHDLSKPTFIAPTAPGQYQLSIVLNDGTAWGAWTYVPITVGTSAAKFIQNYDNGQLAGSNAIADTANNIFANLDGLATLYSEGFLQGVHVAGSANQTATVTGAKLQNDAGLLSVLSGNYSLTVTNLSAQMANGLPSAIASHIQTFSVADTASAVAQNLDLLAGNAVSGTLSAITLTDGGTPTLTITGKQLQSDAAVLNRLTGTYALSVSGASVAQTATTLAQAHVVSISVLDSAANIQSALDTLAPLASGGRIVSITATDAGSPNLALGCSQVKTDMSALNAISGNLHVVVSDTAANIANNLDTLASLASGGKTVSITATDAGSPNLALGCSQVKTDMSALNAISGNLHVVVSDTAANIANTLDMLQALAATGTLSNIIIIGNGIPCFSLTAAQQSADGKALADIACNIALHVTGDANQANALTLSGNFADYTIDRTVTGFSITNNASGQLLNSSGYSISPTAGAAADQLSSIARLKFTDTAVALDIGGNAGEAYRLYQAAFNRKPDLAGLGWQIKAMDAGTSLLQLSQNFMNSSEFKSLYGNNPSDSALVNLLYQNVLHRTPQQFEVDFWTGILNGTNPNSHQTPAEVLMNFSGSAENQAQVIGVIQNGIEYKYYP